MLDRGGPRTATHERVEKCKFGADRVTAERSEGRAQRGDSRGRSPTAEPPAAHSDSGEASSAGLAPQANLEVAKAHEDAEVARINREARVPRIGAKPRTAQHTTSKAIGEYSKK